MATSIKNPKHIDFQKVTKRQAKSIYGRGCNVYLLPSKVRLGSFWIKPVLIPKNESFEATINAFSYYNCNDELGKSVHYYTDG